MASNSISFLGGGRVARILLGGWRHAGIRLDHVSIGEPDAIAAGNLVDEFGSAIEIAENNLAAAADGAIAFLAVHPPMIP